MKTIFNQSAWTTGTNKANPRYTGTRTYAEDKPLPRRNPSKCEQLEREIAEMSLSGPRMMTDQERAEWIAHCRDRTLSRTIIHTFGNRKVVA